METQNLQWWKEEYGFFGNFYMEGDNSKHGYLISKKQTLRERTVAEVDGVSNILGLKGNEIILDIPCGYGRHTIELSKRGFKVFGSDLNSVHLNKAHEEAKKAGVNVILAKENMIDISYSGKFDAIINMFYSFGFFDTDVENTQVLKNFFNALKPAGKLLFHTDVNIPRVLSGRYKEDETRNLLSGNVLRVIDKYDPETKRIYGSWIIRRNDGMEISKEYSVRVYTKDEFISLCEKVGFSRCEAYGGWDKCVYTEDSEDMIIIAIK